MLCFHVTKHVTKQLVDVVTWSKCQMSFQLKNDVHCYRPALQWTYLIDITVFALTQVSPASST